MKQKILDALKTKYSNKGFSKEALNGVASYLEKTVTDESQIDNVVSGVEPLLSVFQSDADKLRNENTTLKAERDELKKKADASTANGDEQSKNKPDKDDDEPAWFTAYKQQQDERYNALKQESDTLKAEKSKAERATLISATAKKYGIPEKFVKHLAPAEDADLDEYFKEVKQDFADQGFELSEPPAQGSGMTNNNSEIAAMIDRGTKQIVEQQKK